MKETNGLHLTMARGGNTHKETPVVHAPSAGLFNTLFCIKVQFWRPLIDESRGATSQRLATLELYQLIFATSP